MTTLDFIKAHRNDDTRLLALRHKAEPGVDIAYALEQIAGWQAARRKLPTWAEAEGIVYPQHISMEQCSSEAAARYKAGVAARLIGQSAKTAADATLTDLTGGFGVDFSFMSQQFGHAVYVERNASLCDIVRKNLVSLGVGNATVVCDDAMTYLKGMEHADMIYMDPARRDSHGARTYAIADCTPDIAGAMEQLSDKAGTLMVKLSPMLDIKQAIADIERSGHAHVSETHVVAVDNECKELLFVIEKRTGDNSGTAPATYCVNDSEVFADSDNDETECPEESCRPTTGDSVDDNIIESVRQKTRHCYLYVPHAAIMKAGCFATVARRFGLRQPDANSHLFVSGKRIDGFPGRRFIVSDITTMNRKELNRALEGMVRANVAVRNFPMSAEALRRKLRLKDGGDTYIFGTTAGKSHMLLICRKDNDDK